MDLASQVVNRLIEKGEDISTMESCTGGAVSNCITNISGSSAILKFCAVTYSNEFKIKMGVDPKVIDKYSVYSTPVSREMAKKISDFTSSVYGIGVTGRFNSVDPSNEGGDISMVFYTIYDRRNDKYYDFKLNVSPVSRKSAKEYIVNSIFEELIKVIN